MTTKNYTYEQLIEKIALAKADLRSSRRSHSDRCAVELDPEGFSPCSCGASAHNSRIESAIEKLKL